VEVPYTTIVEKEVIREVEIEGDEVIVEVPKRVERSVCGLVVLLQTLCVQVR